jgi:flagellar basal-body rod modification protein FlgD
MTTAIQDLISTTRASGTPLAAASATDIQDRFLTLLVTQLKNQDPLSPMDNAQITTQLSQISTVSGIDKLNASVASLAAAMAASQSMSSAAMIGRQVLAPGSTLTLNGGRAAGAFELAEPADQVRIAILGPAGDVVRRLELGAAGTGLKSFTWDGTAQSGAAAKDGAYSFTVEAVRAGKPVTAASYVTGTVSAIGMAGGKDASLVLDGTTEVRFADVRRVQ